MMIAEPISMRADFLFIVVSGSRRLKPALGCSTVVTVTYLPDDDT